MRSIITTIYILLMGCASLPKYSINQSQAININSFCKNNWLLNIDSISDSQIIIIIKEDDTKTHFDTNSIVLIEKDALVLVIRRCKSGCFVEDINESDNLHGRLVCREENRLNYTSVKTIKKLYRKVKSKHKSQTINLIIEK